jgi:hypothetical protein
MKRLCVTVCALLAICVSSALADVPEILSYQGVLTDAAGVAVPDKPYNVTFRLYTMEAGGTPIWQEAHLLTVSKGIFNARLGWTQPLGALDFDLPYYLGISVEGGAELEPRTLLTDAAYAMNARMVKGSAATANKIPATGNVGIGTTSPNYPLTITSSGSAAVPLYVNGNGVTWAGIYINALQSGSQPMFGYCRSGLLKAYTAVSAFDDHWYLYVNGAERMGVTPSGNVGIGVSPPLEKLHVGGGLRIGNTSASAAGTIRWTGADFEGHDGSTWKSLTATGGPGLPAGTSGQTLRHDGSNWIAAGNLYNNGADVNINNAFSIDGAGITRVGGSSVNGDLRLVRGGTSNTMLQAWMWSDGGALSCFDEGGNFTATLEPDIDGEGGFLRIARNSAAAAFIVDGNYNGTAEPRVSIGGSSRSAYFRMDQTGDQCVVLPAGAIGAAEILDEPGVASYAEGGSTGITLTTGAFSTLSSRTIVTPSAGYVLAIASCQARTLHTNGSQSSANFGVSTSSTSLPANQDLLWRVLASMPSGNHDIPLTAHGLFQVASAGSYTYYFLGNALEGTFYAYDFQFTLVYFPTSYGTVQPTLAVAEREGDDARGGSPLGETFAAAERAESEAANNARIERELAAMRAEIETLKDQLNNK